MTTKQRYYMASDESSALEATRVCDFVRFLRFDTGKECALCDLEPGIDADDFGLEGEVVTRVIIANRARGERLSDMRAFPVLVHVARPLVQDIEDRSVITAADVQQLGIADLFRTPEDANGYVYDESPDA